MVLIAASLTFLAPTLWMISSSLKASTEIFVHPIVWIPKDPQWDNYLEAFRRVDLLRFAANTGIIVFFAVLGTVISGCMVAYSLARLRWPGRDFFFSLVMATMMLPGVVTIVPRFILFRTLGWIDTFLPLTVPYWFGTATFSIFLMRQFFRTIPLELDEAARIDGAGNYRILFQIILPLSKPVLATVAVFSLLWRYNEFMNPLIYLNRMDLWTLALGVRFFNSRWNSMWELVFASGTVMLVPVLILFVAAQRYFIQGITMTGFGGR